MDSDRLRQFVLHPEESAKLDFKIELYKINEPKPTVQADIQKWTDAREQQWAELTKDIIALANGNIGTATQIGYLIIGADDKLKPDGTPNLRDVGNKVPTRKEILDKVNSYCQIPLPDIKCEKILLDGINLFVISIPPSPYLHRLSKQLKTPKKEYSPHTVLIRRRDGERTYEAFPEEQTAIEQEKQTTLLKHFPGETGIPQSKREASQEFVLLEKSGAVVF
jgi:predicted HTH transcriptional regulator